MTPIYRLPLRAVFAAALLSVATSFALAGPSMSTSLSPTSLDLPACLKRGEEIMREAGLTRNLQVLQATVYGEQGDYTASVRCLPDKDVVFFVVAGPRPDRASKLMTDLRGRF
jgi:hypothetical protein